MLSTSQQIQDNKKKAMEERIKKIIVDHATKADQDGDGNIISQTYLKKSEAGGVVSGGTGGGSSIQIWKYTE